MTLTKVLVNLPDGKLTDILHKKIVLLAAAGNVRFELFSCCYSGALRNSYFFDKKGEKRGIEGFLGQREALLAEVANKLTQQGFEASYDVCWHKDQAEGVIRQALRLEVDMLLSTMGQCDLGRYLLRQGDWQLIAECPVPLLLVRDQPWAEHPRIMAAVDPFHNCDDPAALDNVIIQQARDVSAHLSGELHLVHSFEPLPQYAIFDEHATPDYETLQAETITRKTEAMQALVQEKNLTGVLMHLEAGEVHEVVPQVCQQEEINMLVIGSIARGPLGRLLIGSSIERIINNIACDVLLVKEPDFISPVAEN